eukprot:7388935-Prorocentrum_lima.AAC.1
MECQCTMQSSLSLEPSRLRSFVGFRATGSAKNTREAMSAIAEDGQHAQSCATMKPGTVWPG